MAITAEIPEVGQSIAITREPLEGLIGIIFDIRDAEWIIELPVFGAGVLLSIDPAYCVPAT